MKIGLIWYIKSFHDKRSHKKVCRKFLEKKSYRTAYVDMLNTVIILIGQYLLIISVISSYVYLPPQCSAAGTGWCRRGRGWRWWCGRSWRGSGPTGTPGSQRPVFLKPTPEGRERRKRKRQMLTGWHVLEENGLSCCAGELWGLLSIHSPWNRA